MITKHINMKYSQCGCLDGTIYPCSCRTIDQCWRSIVDMSYGYKEYFPLVETVRKAMLPRD